ncbi:High-affinity branched-chain amino acid transport ATP-binding protein LivF [Geodia barretti]|jgi:urea transport system ATP-binding protein|uniref:High-affinity branched-chain amino acid transport ATP-binding protein LivF n=1 Tax=Geodia barretti TaxID=519541 RepID=A0AA35W6W8_GEOBA|nr:High-affinity branched-chain amino acid transport ATP-binding protein LivF [Geodia barretti]
MQYKEPLLNIRGLAVGYGQSLVLSDVALEVPEGQVVCLMGRNGVGKTTLLKAIMGLLNPRAGQVRFAENDLTKWAPHRRAKAGFGYVPQGRHIFPYLTVNENLLMGLEAFPGKKGRPEAVDRMYTLFPALKLNPKKTAGTLSGGQQQQLALARALIRQPRLLLLDEPTEGIQPSIVQEIEELLQRLRDQQDTTILLVEQFLDFALGIADYCYVMEKGAIVLEGTARDLDYNLVREYVAV